MNTNFLSVLNAGALLLATAVAASGQTRSNPTFLDEGGVTLPSLSVDCECAAATCCCDTAGAGTGSGRGGRLFVGGDSLLIQPTFSEAVAFARGVQTPTSLSLQAVELDFDHEPAFRIHGGYRLDNGGGEVFFEYTRMTAEVAVGGGVNAPNEFLVDPFGAIVGQVVVIDPSNRLFGQVLPGALGLPVADRIATRAEVELNVWDLDVRRDVPLQSPAWGMQWSAGARLADVEQYYSSRVTAGPATISFGEYNVDYIGAGPRMGMSLERRGAAWAVFASGHGSLLLGSYDVEFSASPAPGFNAGQQASSTRVIPVTELEAGARLSPLANVNLSAGWLFHSWFDLGTSGGTFAGLFTGQDDANIMSFNGLFLRGELLF